MATVNANTENKKENKIREENEIKEKKRRRKIFR